MGSACSMCRETRNAYRILVGNPARGGSLRKPGRRREDTIKTDLREIWRGCMIWMNVAKSGNQRNVFCEYCHKPSGSIGFGVNFLVAAQLAASQEGLSSVELVRLVSQLSRIYDTLSASSAMVL
jgi:hypothetical protein